MKVTRFYTRSSPRTRGPSLCPLKVRAIWQSLDSRVRGNERMWQFPHTLEGGGSAGRPRGGEEPSGAARRVGGDGRHVSIAQVGSGGCARQRRIVGVAFRLSGIERCLVRRIE